MADTTYNGLVASSVPTDPNLAAGGGTGTPTGGSASADAGAGSAAPAAATQAAAAAPAQSVTAQAAPAAAAPQVTASQAAAASQADVAAQAIANAPPAFETWAKSQSDYVRSLAKAGAQQRGTTEENVLRQMYDVTFADNGDGFVFPATKVIGKPVTWGDVQPLVSPEVAANPLAAKQVRTIAVGPDTQTDPNTGLPIATPGMLADQYGLQQPPTVYKRGMGYDPANPDENAAIKQLQTQLARAGYYHNGIDGLFGPITENAVARYRADNDLGKGKTLDNSVIAHLEYNFPAGGVPTPVQRPYNGPLPTARPSRPGDNALVASSRPVDLNPANRLYGGAGGATMSADDQIAAAMASPAQPPSLLPEGPRTKVPTVAEIRAANPIPTELAPAPAPDTSLPSTFTPGAVAAGDYGIDVRQPAGLASNAKGIASDGSRMATPEQMRAAAARAAAAAQAPAPAPGAPVAEPAAAQTVVPIAPAVPAPGDKLNYDRVPATMYWNGNNPTGAPPEAPKGPNPRPLSGDLSGLPQVASLEAAPAAFTPPYVSPEWDRLMNPAPMTEAPAPISTTGQPGAATPMGVRVPADKPAPAPATGTIRGAQPASVAQLQNPQFYTPEAYVSFAPGQYYYDPQGNLRQKAGATRMAA